MLGITHFAGITFLSAAILPKFTADFKQLQRFVCFCLDCI